MKSIFFVAFTFIGALLFGQSNNYSFCGISSPNDASLNSISEIAKADTNIVSLKYLAKQRLLIAEVKQNPNRKKEFDLFNWMQKSETNMFIYRKMVKQEFLAELLATSDSKSLK
jgi:hypothetical protein